MLVQQKIRATAQAVIQRGSAFLVYESFDKIKKEYFYRPVGGGVDFLEPAAKTVLREVYEELGIEVVNPVFLGFSENIFTFEGLPGHELVQIFQCEFKDKANYERESFVVIESGRNEGSAVWKSRDDLLKPEVRFYPNGMKDIISKIM